MQLDKLVIETRLRNGWSAIDLGITFARQFWLRSVCLYLIVALPIYLLTWFFPDGWVLLSYLFLWWFKPLLERPILFMMSRELFGESVSYRQCLAMAKHWLSPGLLWILTLRRLSIARGMYAPVSLLEQPSRGDYSRRTVVLGMKFSEQAAWLTVVLFHIESFLSVAVIGMMVLVMPDSVDFDAWLGGEVPVSQTLLDMSGLLIMAAIAPFYVAGGFMLYISRRVELEGWDIEICFRDWMANYKKPETHSAPLATAAANIEA